MGGSGEKNIGFELNVLYSKRKVSSGEKENGKWRGCAVCNDKPGV